MSESTPAGTPRRLAEAWARWSAQAVDGRATLSQKSSLRTAFYSGMHTALGVLVRECISSEGDVLQVDVQRLGVVLSEMSAELDDWQAQIAEADAARTQIVAPGISRILRG